MFSPKYFGGWVDASCTIAEWTRCVCKLGGAASAEYANQKNRLGRGGSDYKGCYDDDDDEGEDEDDGRGRGGDSGGRRGDDDDDDDDDEGDARGRGDGSGGGREGDDDGRRGGGGSTAECPDGWSRSRGGGDCFKVAGQDKTFVECQLEVCAPEGGSLASIRSLKENDLVSTLMSETGTNFARDDRVETLFFSDPNSLLFCVETERESFLLYLRRECERTGERHTHLKQLSERHIQVHRLLRVRRGRVRRLAMGFLSAGPRRTPKATPGLSLFSAAEIRQTRSLSRFSR